MRFILKIKPLIILVLCALALNAYSNNSNEDHFPRTFLDFYILESEISEGNYLTGDFYANGFIRYNNSKMPNTRPADDRMITLRSEFSIDAKYKDQNLYLVVLPLNYPCKIYLNGNLIQVIGSTNGIYTNRVHYSDNILLAPDLLNISGKNEIAFQLFPEEGENYPLGEVFISNSKDATKYVFYRNLVGPKLIFALQLCGFVFFVFFLITYITRREYQKQHFLFFALMNLFFVISYINNIFTYDFSNIYLLEKISRTGFPLSILVGIVFLIEYTNVFKRKNIIKLVLAILYIPAAILVLIPDNTTKIINVYNTYPLYSLFVGSFILLLISVLYFIRERDLKSGILTLAFILNIVSGLHDGYFFAVLQTKPYILLTPISVFAINLTIFFILVIDNSKLYHLAISSSKKLEKLNQDLEKLVEKRTQKTIEYANMLEEANNTKDKFFSIIAHDLKNPFNTLIGYSDILKSEFREYREDEIYQQLHIIHDTSVKGYNLLDNLLQWSRSQTNTIPFNPVKVDLYDIMQICLSDVEYQCQFKDIEIHNEIKKGFYFIADKNLIITVIRNLISNAVKFTPRNGLITLSADKDPNNINITIKDTGVGISPEDIEKLFKIDKVISRPGTNKEKGSGLGLILCKEFVEKHGGEIWVESEIEKGSEFKFSIPKVVLN